MSIEEVDYYLKPMNCPGHIMIYKSQVRSYRELPIRLAELGTVYRYERSGTLHGMLRVRGFTQDDAHIFCTPDQVVDEVERRDRLRRAHGRRLRLRVQGLPRDAAREGDRRRRDLGAGDRRAEGRRWTGADSPYKIDEGGGAFYGPKIDIKWVDALGREWTGPTIQVDFNLPERFDVNYIGEDGERHRAVMIHRTLLGSMERFVGGLIEHYAGAFPVWLAPVQAAIIPITDDQVEYAEQVEARAGRARACASRSTSRATACRRRSATPSSRRCPTCWWSASARPRPDAVAVRLRTGRGSRRDAG